MIKITRTLWATACACLAWWALTTQVATAADLPRSTPEQQGIASSAVADFVAGPGLGNRGRARPDGVAARSRRGRGLVGALPPRIRPHALLPEQEFHIDRHWPRNRRGTVESRRPGHLVLPRCGAGRTGLASRGHAHPRSPVHVDRSTRRGSARLFVRLRLASPGSLPAPSRGPQAGHPFQLQHSRNVHVVGDCPDSHRGESAGLPATRGCWIRWESSDVRPGARMPRASRSADSGSA